MLGHNILSVSSPALTIMGELVFEPQMHKTCHLTIHGVVGQL